MTGQGTSLACFYAVPGDPGLWGTRAWTGCGGAARHGLCIPVAKALDRIEIEAQVTIWRVAVGAGCACPRCRTQGIVHLTKERIGLLARSEFPTWPMYSLPRCVIMSVVNKEMDCLNEEGKP